MSDADYKGQPLSKEELLKAYLAEHAPSQDQKWAAFDEAEAPLIRQSLIKADLLRGGNIDAGDAYLQGVADAHYQIRRQALVAEVGEAVREIPDHTNT